jgi:hypothetical protein
LDLLIFNHTLSFIKGDNRLEKDAEVRALNIVLITCTYATLELIENKNKLTNARKTDRQ